MNTQTFLSRAAMLVCLTASADAAVAQQAAQQAAEVRGTVKDPIGAGIGEAVITLEDANHLFWITTSDAEGRYALVHLPAGAYTFTASFPGFKDFASPVTLRAGQTAPVTPTLNIAYTEAIEVRQSLSDPLRNPSNVILSSRDIEKMPAEETLFLERLAQLAGATRPEDLTLLVDGFREFKRIPPTGTIDVIRINSNPFSAEFAGKSARRVEITTKPGVDMFHGSARLQFRNSHLNGRAAGEPALAPMQYHNANGYLQGPISKGRAGFLLYGGTWEQDENTIVRSTVLYPETKQPVPFTMSIASPLRQTSLLAKLDFKLFNQRMNASFMRNTGRHANQGLEGGFALPEYSYETASTDDVVRMWWATIGRRSVNDVRVQISSNHTALTPKSIAPALIVLDAFSSGGNPTASGARYDLAVEAVDTFIFQTGRHLLKGGVQINTVRRQSTDRAGFNGAFTFGAGVDRDVWGNPLRDASGAPIVISPIETYRRAVLGRAGYAPSQFMIVTGSPEIRASQWRVGAFALDDWTLSKSLSVSWGIRQDVQSDVGRQALPAPRGYLSWAIDENSRNVLRIGSGVFTTPVDVDLAFQTIKLDGTHQQTFIVSNPAFFPTIPPAGSLPGNVTPTIYTMASDLQLPRTLRTSATFERRLHANLLAVAEYAYDRGSHLLRSRLLDGSTRTFQFESTGRSDEHALLLALRGHLRLSTFYLNYTLATRQGDTDGAHTLLANAADPSADYGFLANDRRHEVSAGATLVLPYDIYLSPNVTFSSGVPFNIVTGIDNNGDSVFVDRPGIAEPGAPGAVSTPYGWLTAAPGAGATIVARNIGRDPNQSAFNLSIAKMFKNGLAFTFDVQNVLNQSRLVASNGVLSSSAFGLPNRSLNGRRVEMGVRFDF